MDCPDIRRHLVQPTMFEDHLSNPEGHFPPTQTKTVIYNNYCELITDDVQ